MIKSENFFQKFFKLESAGGILLLGAAVLAILIANSPLNNLYQSFFLLPLNFSLGEFAVNKPLLLWVNDGLMAVFFLLVGLELKRELIEGELSQKKNILLPGVGAIGGMAVPALFYMLFNLGDPVAMKGWAIPAATDIAFALGILAFLGSRVPLSLKIFLTSLAIFDDVGAIIIIALFYTSKISLGALAVVGICIIVLAIFNNRGYVSKSIYILVGVVMWVAALKSGVHATLTGVILAMFIPLNSKSSEGSPLKELEHDLHHTVAFFILPVFAFANAGLPLGGISMDMVLHGVPMGIASGLFFGKQLGIFGFCWLIVKLNWVPLPKGMNMWMLYGTACLCGVGFTMSLFIGSLAFEETSVNLLFDERLGIILGSLASGLVGFFILKANLKPKGI